MNAREAEELGFNEAKAHPAIIFGLYALAATIAWNIPIHWVLRILAFVALTLLVAVGRILWGVIMGRISLDDNDQTGGTSATAEGMPMFAQQSRDAAPDETRRSPFAEGTASLLHKILVVEQSSHRKRWAERKEYGVPFYIPDRFARNMRLYREAMVHMVLLNKSIADEDYRMLLRAYEGIILPRTRTLRDKKRFDDLEKAMLDLQTLLSEGKSITWALEWMKRNNIESHNPLNLMKFATMWMIRYANLVETVEKLKT